MSTGGEDTLAQAEQAADRIRQELWRTLDELDRRRSEAMSWRLVLRRNWALFAAAGATAAALIAARVWLGRRARAHEAQALRRERVRSLRRAWQHPERIAPVRHSRASELGSKVLTLLGTAVAAQLAGRVAKRVAG